MTYCSILPFFMAVLPLGWGLVAGSLLTILLLESMTGQTVSPCRTQSQHLRNWVVASPRAPGSILQKPVGAQPRAG